jgi:hypothetical protein
MDVYCKICNGCGENGCCSAENCQQHEDGMYCDTYLLDLKFNSLMFRDMYDLLAKNHKIELDEFYDKNYELIYKKDEK